jgi:hypothetical protein
MLLPAFFLIVAIIYSSVGFGGGTSYIALLILSGASYVYIPAVALICNIVVVSGNSINYARLKQLNFNLLIPHLIGSVPAAYIGGLIHVQKTVFEWLIFISLAVAGFQILYSSRKFTDDSGEYKIPPRFVAVSVGAVLGFLSGMLGIGGGIFLAPVLYLLKAGPPKQIASTASLFIFINSIAGLTAQVQKHNLTDFPPEFLILPIVVFIGGQIGNHFSLKTLTAPRMALITSLLVLFVSFRIGLKLFVIIG